MALKTTTGTGGLRSSARAGSTEATFKDSHKNKSEEFYKKHIKLDQNGPEEEGIEFTLTPSYRL